MTEENKKDEEEGQGIEKKKEGDEEEVIGPEILETLTPKIKEMAEFGFSMQRYSGPHPELVKKLTSEHIGEIIDQSGKDDERQYKFAAHGRIYRLIYILLGFSLFLFLSLYFGKENESLYIDMIKTLIAFGGGFGIGYGYRSQKE